ncbi:MBL fold metallo-hydrolase [Pendulispora rubella]|uniref:MBL fold metallo-hydrolase n=1 Tax=Pendulispora rubella TaxID=2741070 RepID=A0ABZ2L7R6_9BACT
MLRNVIGKIGAVEVCRVLDSTLVGETMQHWFPDFDRELVRPHEHWLCPTHYDPESGHFRMPVHSWVFKMHGKTFLIDTCNGNHKQRPGTGLAEFHMLDTKYLQRLADVGVRPDDVDFVLCTHLHVDHVGWNTMLENGRWVPTFRNARYIMSATEYEAAKAEAVDSTKPVFLRHVFEDSIHPIVEAGLSDLVEDNHEVMPGLRLRPAPGHSPGHVRIELRSTDQIGVFSGDLLHSPVQVPLWQWSSVVCWDRALSTKSRRELLDFCAAENAILLGGHFENPHVGRIRSVQDSFRIDFGF